MVTPTVDGDASASETGVVTALWHRTRLRDALALGVIPLVLVWVYTLPAATRRSLSFVYTDPTLVSAYTAHFVHFRLDHLAANLLAYLLLVGVCYALAVLAGRRLFFAAGAVTIVLAFPFLLSGLNLLFPRYAISYGSSGLNMGLFGLLPLLLVSYAARRLDVAIPVRAAPAAFFALLGWMVLLALPLDPVTIVLAAAAATGTVVYAISLGPEQFFSIEAAIDRVVGAGGFGDLFTVGLVLAVAYPLVGFPSDPATTGRVINIYSHLLGFSLGFIGPYVLLEAGVFDGAD